MFKDNLICIMVQTFEVYGNLFIYLIYFVYMDPTNFRTADMIQKILVRNSAEIHRNIVGSSPEESDSQPC